MHAGTGGMLLDGKVQVHFHIFPKYVLWSCSCSYAFWASIWTHSLYDTRFITRLWGKKTCLSCLNSYIPGPWTVIFFYAVSCVDYEALPILLGVQLGKASLKNTWTVLWSIQNILSIAAWSWKIKKHLFSTQIFSARPFLQKIMVFWLLSEKSKHFSFWPGGKCFTQPVCSRYSQNQKLITLMKLEVKSSFLLFQLSEWRMKNVSMSG